MIKSPRKPSGVKLRLTAHVFSFVWSSNSSVAYEMFSHLNVGCILLIFSINYRYKLRLSKWCNAENIEGHNILRTGYGKGCHQQQCMNFMNDTLVNCLREDLSVVDFCADFFALKYNSHTASWTRINESKKNYISNMTSIINSSFTFDAVYDFHCWAKFPASFFHSLIDCSVETVLYLRHSLAKKFTSVGFVSPNYLQKWTAVIMQAFLDSKIMVTPFYYDDLSNFYMEVNITKYWMTHRQSDAWVTCRSCFKHLTLSHQNISHYDITRSACYILIIFRLNGGRVFVDSQNNRDYNIVYHFKNRFGEENVKIYFGNESFSETIHLFSKACAIVGAHGAGFANAILCRHVAYVLEITTFRSKSAASLEHWRSNNYIFNGTEAVFFSYHIDHNCLTPTRILPNDPVVKIVQEKNPSERKGGRPNLDFDLLLQLYFNYHMTREHIENVMSLVCAHVSQRFHMKC